MIKIKRNHRFRAVAVICIVGVVILGCCYLFPTSAQIPEAETTLRQQYIQTAEQWLGCNQADGSHQQIIDLYNRHTPLAQNYIVQYSDAWCAAFVSAVAIECGLTDIIPTECGCQRQIELFKQINAWQEDDNYIPLPGDLIFYSTNGAKASADNTGWSDHVGIVVSVRGRYITTIEGNYNGQVAYRHLWVGDSRIRGYGLPDFSSVS